MSETSRFQKTKRRFKKTNKYSYNVKFSEKDICISSSETMGPSLFKKLFSQQKTLFLSILSFRIFNSFIIQTASVPDEYWQSVEVAHKLVFNIGYLTWEWQPDVAIRSPIYPLVFAIPFKILQLSHLDNRILIIKIPLLMHAVLAAVTDFYLYKFAFLHSGQTVAQWTLLHQLLSWFTFYHCTRTLANNVEWSLFVLCLYHYVLGSDSPHGCQPRPLSRRLACLCGLCLVIRPTALVLMAPLAVHHLHAALKHRNTRVLAYSLRNCVVVGLFLLALSVIAEKHFYGRWTCSQANFLFFNLLTDVAQTYGVHPWHWYLTSGLPAMLGLQLLPLAAAAAFLSGSAPLWLLVGVVIQAYSFLGHKEFRFVLPLLPVLHLLIGQWYAAKPFSSSSCRRWLLGATVAVHVPLMLYTALLHQRGTIDVISSIGRHLESHHLHQRETAPLSVVFLMPCHSTPWSSHLHHNVSSRFLTCDPQITGSIHGPALSWGGGSAAYDEADSFYRDPIGWLQTEYKPIARRPHLWVMFDSLLSTVSPLLIGQWNYSQCRRFFHAHFPTHGRHGNRVLVLCAVNHTFPLL